MAKTMLDIFIEFLLEQVRNHSIYIWGAQGQTGAAITEAWIRGRETSEENAKRAIAYWKKQVAEGFGAVLRAFDCSGLGMYFLQNLQGIIKGDLSANSMMGKCKAISRAELKRGDWVFRVDSAGKANHIGYVVDNALNVVEAKGRDDGVVLRDINASGKTYWNAYGRPDIFAAEIEGGQSAPIAPAATTLTVTSPLMRSDAIKLLQEALNAMGYPCGTPDGICGNNTMAGVRAFVAAHMGV